MKLKRILSIISLTSTTLFLINFNINMKDLRTHELKVESRLKQIYDNNNLEIDEVSCQKKIDKTYDFENDIRLNLVNYLIFSIDFKEVRNIHTICYLQGFQNYPIKYTDEEKRNIDNLITVLNHKQKNVIYY